jgi:hypothetical protein
VAPRDAQTPPLKESFAALARQTLDAAHDHVPECALPIDDRKARMCPRSRSPLPLLLLRAAAADAAASASCCGCCCFELLLLLLLRAAAAAASCCRRCELLPPLPSSVQSETTKSSLSRGIVESGWYLTRKQGG